jgi:Glycosyl transferases group 1
VEKDYSSSPPIGIAAYSDFYDVPAKRVWGDYWLKEDLLREFRAAGYPVDNSRPKVLLHLFGEPLKEVRAAAYNILWIHSHPDWISPEILGKYQKIYCISKLFTEKICQMGFRAEWLMIPTCMTPAEPEMKFDIVFVGNTKQGKARKIVGDMGTPSCGVRIWGWGWKGLIPDEWYGGEYYEHRMLGSLYSSARIVLNDHHGDMKREGFINPRILDVLASGGFVLSDRVEGMDDIFLGSVPSYDTPEELRRLLEVYINDDEGRRELSRKGREIALQYTYRTACAEIIRHISAVR